MKCIDVVLLDALLTNQSTQSASLLVMSFPSFFGARCSREPNCAWGVLDTKRKSQIELLSVIVSYVLLTVRIFFVLYYSSY